MLFTSIPVVCRREIFKETGAQVKEVVCRFAIKISIQNNLCLQERYIMLENNRRPFLLWTRARIHNHEIVACELRVVTFSHCIEICTLLALIGVTARYTSLCNHEELLKHQTVKMCDVLHDESYAHRHLTSEHGRSCVFPFPRTWFWIFWCAIYIVSNPHYLVHILLCLHVGNAQIAGAVWCHVTVPAILFIIHLTSTWHTHAHFSNIYIYC
jgi:hypothetical protein